MNKLTLRGPRCLVKPDGQPETTDSGLHIVDHHHVDKTGVVVAVGDGPVTGKGVVLPHYVGVGDHVLFPPDAGEDLFFEHERLICLNEGDILAVLT